MNRDRFRPSMDNPAIYRIRVLGHLSDDLSGRLGGMNITRQDGANGEEAVLVGRLMDQSALSGVLNSLYELHLPVLSVDCLMSDDTDE